MALAERYRKDFTLIAERFIAESNRLVQFTQGLVHAPNFAELDYLQFFKPNSEDYQYWAVREVIDKARPQIMDFYASLRPIMDSPNLSAVPDEMPNDFMPYWNNGFFAGGDARSVYAIAATFNPPKWVEIGSGNSTKFLRKSIIDHGLRTKITCIDPVPRAEISKIADEIILKPLNDMPLDFFRGFNPQDVLFFDGSHIGLNGSDVTQFFINILPLIPAGTLIHVHDVMLPYEYIQIFTERFYNEQYFLAMLLMQTERWQPLLPIHWMTKEKMVPEQHAGVSFWFRAK